VAYAVVWKHGGWRDRRSGDGLVHGGVVALRGVCVCGCEAAGDAAGAVGADCGAVSAPVRVPAVLCFAAADVAAVSEVRAAGDAGSTILLVVRSGGAGGWG